jgi:hypothetical protein
MGKKEYGFEAISIDYTENSENHKIEHILDITS